MGQAGSVQQKCALRDVLVLRRSNASNTEFEEVLRTFCAVFPLELQVPVDADFASIVNAVNIDVKERRLFDAIHGLLQDQTEHSRGRNMTELTLTTFRRIIRWRELYKLCAKCSMTPFFAFLLDSSHTPILAVLETLELMLSPCSGFETGDKAADRSEAANRRHFGESGGFDVLRSLLIQHGNGIIEEKQKEYTANVLAGVLRIFHLTLVERRHVTEVMTSTQAVKALMNARVSLLDLCHHRDGEYKVMRLAIALVKELFCRVEFEERHELQESARDYGALLYALERAVQEKVENNEDVPDLCADLVNVFCTGNKRSTMTMYCIFPVELFINELRKGNRAGNHVKALSSSVVKTSAAARSAMNSQHSLIEGVEQRSRISAATSNRSVTNEVAESKQNRIVAQAYPAMTFSVSASEDFCGDLRERWRDIIKALRKTHESAELVWRAPMRAELCYALQMEIEMLECRRRELSDKDDAHFYEKFPRWNYEMFHVEYASMHDELVVNGHFVEYLIPQLADSSAAYEVVEPITFAYHLVDQLAVAKDEKWLYLCILCLRLVITRYAMLFQDHVPTQCVQLLLRDHRKHSPALVRECFLFLHAAITTTRDAPSKNFNELCTTMAQTIVSVLADPILVATFAGALESKSDNALDGIACLVKPENEAGFVVNERDALIRAGISLLLALARRGKFVLRLVRLKRLFLCRLLAVETLDHVTITRLLLMLEQLALLDGKIANNSSIALKGVSNFVPSASLPLHSSLSTDSNWRSLTLVYVLLASCDPEGMGMCVAAAEFLQKCCALYTNSSGESDLNQSLSPNQLNDLLDEALGCNGCGITRLLLSSSAEAFADIFNAPETRAADVKWGRKQRVRLYRHLKLKYLGSGEPSWCNNVDNAVDHTYKDDDLLIGNIYLREYIKGGGEFLSEWTPEMYGELISALLEKLVQLGRRNSAFTIEIGSGKVGPTPLPNQQLSLSQTSSNSSSCAAESWEVQVLILKALARLVPSHGANVVLADEVYETLLAPLRRSMLSEIDQVRGILSLELIVAVLSYSETRSVNLAACRLFLEEKGLSVMADALERMRTPAFQHMLQDVEVFSPHHRINPGQMNTARVLLYRATDVLSILVRQQTAGIHAIAKNPNVVTALIELSSRPCIMQSANVDTASVCLNCLGGLCHYDELRTLVLNAGGLLSLVDTVAFCPAEEPYKAANVVSQDIGERSESATMNIADGHREGANVILPTMRSTDGSFASASEKISERRNDRQRIPSRFFGAIRSAALVLRACLGPTNLPTSSLSSHVLCQLLTPSFVQVLRTSPDQFILKLQTTEDISTATLIWTVSMRQRLHQCIATQLEKVKVAATAKAWPRWDPEHFVAVDTFRYQYPELTDVLVLHDVYLANFVATRVDDKDLCGVDKAAFSQALLISIQSHENVLRILQERGTSDPTKEAEVRLMREALNKLVQIHPQHNVEVASSDAILLSDSSRAMSPASCSSNTLPTAVRSFISTNDRDWDVTHIERCSSSGIEDLTV